MVPSHFQLLLQGCLQEYQSPQSLGIVCQDGKLSVNILVLNFICPNWLNSILSMDSILILPSVKIQDLDTFFTCLQTDSTLLPKHLLSQLECSVSNLSPFFNLSELFQDNNNATAEEAHLFQNDQEVLSMSAILHTTPVTIMELTKENITKISDEDFQDNFSDQEGRLVCLACYKMFQPKSFALLRTHLATHPEGILKKISIHLKPENITATTTTQNKIQIQRKSKMTKSKPKIQFSCKICLKKFLSQKLLQNHEISKVCDTVKRKCVACNKIFSDSTRLKYHMRITHSGLKPWTCTTCDKTFGELRSLKEHRLIHAPARQHSCNHCGKKFIQKNHLKYHLASNHGESAKVLECQICQKAFAFPFQLRKHEKSHD